MKPYRKVLNLWPRERQLDRYFKKEQSWDRNRIFGEVRILHWSDRDHVRALVLENRESIAKQTGRDPLGPKSYLLEELLRDSYTRHSVGHFDRNGELTAMVRLVPWDFGPFACLSHMMVRAKGQRLFRPEKNGYYACLDQCLRLGESRGIFNYFFFREKLKKPELRDKFWKKHQRHYATLSRYDSIRRSLIPADLYPEQEFFRIIMEYRTWPYDIEICELRLSSQSCAKTLPIAVKS